MAAENGGPNPETNKTKLFYRLCRKSLFSKKEWQHINKEFKKVRSGDCKSIIMCSGSMAIIPYPTILAIYSFVHLFDGNKNKMDIFVYCSLPFIAFSGILQYLGNADTLYSSIFEIGEERILEYLADKVFKECVLNAIQVAALIYQFIKGEQSKFIFITVMLGFGFYVARHFSLILGKKNCQT